MWTLSCSRYAASSMRIVSCDRSGLRWLTALVKEPVTALLVVQPRHTAERQQLEAERLAETYSGQLSQVVLVGRARSFVPSAATYLGSGTVEGLKSYRELVNEIFVNAVLTGVQVRNLEETLGCRVLDRIGLIVNIFAQRAHTREAKLQVELACLQLARTRLVRVLDSTGRPSTFGSHGQSQVVSGRERGRGGGSQGGLGGGSQGETEIVLQRSRIRDKIQKVKSEIETVKKTRHIHRQARKRNSIPVVAVVGYTNTGKSTLVSRLTKSELECDDLYFKTLDPISRQLRLSNGRVCVVSDTVGFISDLPLCLFAAFRATLEEASHADLILHVIDANAQNRIQQRQEVYRTLREVGVSDAVLKKRTIEAFNKVDQVERANGGALCLLRSRTGGQLQLTSLSPSMRDLDDWLDVLRREEPGYRPERVLTSALMGTGMTDLKLRIEEKLMGS